MSELSVTSTANAGGVGQTTDCPVKRQKNNPEDYLTGSVFLVNPDGYKPAGNPNVFNGTGASIW